MEVLEHVIDHDAGIVFLSETWMEADKNDITATVKSYGYTLLHNRRKNREKEIGGGVGVMIKTSMIHKHIKCKTYTSFEHTMIRVNITKNTKLILVTIYRLQFKSAATFLKEFRDYLEMLSVMAEDFVLSGDINFHLETNDQDVLSLEDLWDTFDLVQHVRSATQRMGHTLDLVLTRKNTPIIRNIIVENVELSDHFMIIFDMDIEVLKYENKMITYRNIKSIDCELFANELKQKLLEDESISFGDRVHNYNSVLRGMLHDYAPLQTKTIKVVPSAPWFDTEYKELRRRRRKAERKYKKSKSDADKETFVNIRKQATEMSFRKKREHCTKKINESNGTKGLFNCVYDLLDQKKGSVLPTHDSSSQLATQFNEYFKEKISNIRKSFPPYKKVTGNSCNFKGVFLEVFEPTTEDEIKKMIMTHGIKCSPEDPLPAALLTNLVDTFIPIWVDLINLSLEQGSMDCLKCGVLAPLIKDLDSAFDTEAYKNYRPVTNLQLLGKLIERVVADRLDTHMDTHNLHSSKQYAYKVDHSAELLLTKVTNDLLLACDQKTPTLVMFLDLSAAFDTVDQEKLLDILHDDIGVRGMALEWFDAFLRNRTQKVKIGDEYSSEVNLDYGVAQGSILGPKLFNIYTKPFPSELKVLSISVEGYADDNQLLKKFNLVFQFEVLGEGINETFKVIERWMLENFLKLNGGKTQIMIVLPECMKSELIINGTFINGSCIRFVESAKNLGVYIDSTLSMDGQVQKVVSSCFGTIRLLSRIKYFLTIEQLQVLVCSLILSIMDYCNLLYYGLSAKNLDKLQSVQNSAARLVCKVNGYDKVSSGELCKKLHWLKVRERVVYKVLITVFKCLNGSAPVDLRELLHLTRSSRSKKLESKKCNGVMGDRAFSVCGPRLWNALPVRLRLVEELDDFKKDLKTYLFTDSDSFYEVVHRK